METTGGGVADARARRRWRLTRAAATPAPHVAAEIDVTASALAVLAEPATAARPVSPADPRTLARRAPGPLARTVARALVAIEFALPGRRRAD